MVRLALFLACLPSILAACTSNSSSTADLQSLLQNGGQGYKLQLCKEQVYNVTAPLNFTAASQVCYFLGIASQRDAPC